MDIKLIAVTVTILAHFNVTLAQAPQSTNDGSINHTEQDNCVATNIPTRLTIQDQRSYIAISAAANVPAFEVIRRLRAAVNRREVYSDIRIRQLYREFQDKSRPDTNDQRCTNSRPINATDQGNEDGIEHLMSIRRDWTVDEIVLELGISHGSVVTLLARLGYKKVNAVWIPHELDQPEKRNRVGAANENLRWFRRNARILGRIIAFDETVWRCYTPPDPNQAAQWRRRGERPPTRVAQYREPWSRHLIMAVRQDQIIGHGWLNDGERWTQDTILRFLNETIRPYVEQTMPGETPIILMDNARWHTAGRVQDFIRIEMEWKILRHPPFSPDFDPLDREVFQKIKRPFKGRRFENSHELTEVVKQEVININNNHTLIGTSNLPDVWRKIVEVGGDYYFKNDFNYMK